MSDIKHNVEFEREVLAQCLTDQKYMRKAAEVLDRTHFLIKEHSWIWTVIKKIWREFAERPKAQHFIEYAGRKFADEDIRKANLHVVRQLYQTDTSSSKASLDELRRFIRTADLEMAIRATADQLQQGRYDEAWDPIKDLMRGELRERKYQISRWSEEALERQEERRIRKIYPNRFKTIPTGIYSLDKKIVGMCEGEFGMIVGTKGRGKTSFAIQLGYHAISCGYTVVQFSTEMAVKRVAQRYDSRFSGIRYRKFKHYEFNSTELKKYEELVAEARKKFDKKLRIISIPLRSCNIDVIKNALDDVRDEIGSDIDMVIIDSVDHMQPIRRVESFRLSQKEVYTDVKDLLESQELIGWTTAHAGKEYENKVAKGGSASESYDKEKLVDVMLTLNERKRYGVNVMSDEPIEDESKGGFEIFVEKLREEEDKFYIPLDADLSRMIITEAEGE